MDQFLVGDVFKHFDRQGMIRGLRKLHVELDGFILGRNHKTYGPNQLLFG